MENRALHWKNDSDTKNSGITFTQVKNQR